jgi:hypothetical protein
MMDGGCSEMVLCTAFVVSYCWFFAIHMVSRTYCNVRAMNKTTAVAFVTAVFVV